MQKITNNEELLEYIVDMAEKQKPILYQNDFRNTFVLKIPDNVEINTHTYRLKKGDYLHISSDKTIIPSKSGAPVMRVQKPYKKADLYEENGSFIRFPVSAKSDYLKSFEDEFNKNGISYTKSTFSNKKGNKIVALSVVKHASKDKNISDKIKKIASNIKSKYKDKNIQTGEVVGESDELVHEKTEYNSNILKNKYTDKYITELQRIPEQEKDAVQALLKEIHDHLLKCEVYLGEMREAQNRNDAIAYQRHKDGLQKELYELKNLEVKLVKSEKEFSAFEKVYALHLIHEMSNEADKQFQLLQIENITNPFMDKKTKEKLNDGYTWFIKWSMDMRENLGEALLGRVAGIADIHTTIETHKPEVVAAKYISVNDKETSNGISQYLDGTPNKEYTVSNHVIDSTADDILNADYKPGLPHYDFETPPLEKERVREGLIEDET